MVTQLSVERCIAQMTSDWVSVGVDQAFGWIAGRCGFKLQENIGSNDASNSTEQRYIEDCVNASPAVSKAEMHWETCQDKSLLLHNGDVQLSEEQRHIGRYVKTGLSC